MVLRPLLAFLLFLYSSFGIASTNLCGPQAESRAKELFTFHSSPEVKDSPVITYSKAFTVKRPYKRKGNLLVELEVIVQFDARANYIAKFIYVNSGTDCFLVGEEIYEEWAKR